MNRLCNAWTYLATALLFAGTPLHRALAQKTTAHRQAAVQKNKPSAARPRATVCYGQQKPLTISSHMPYVLASVGGASGYFVLDFGTTASTIDPKAFAAATRPAPVAGTTNQFDSFDFFGSWGRVTLGVQDHSNIAGRVRQAGIIGTDFLSLNAFTLDYANGYVYRATQQDLCSDATLTAAGLQPVSTAGYYSNDISKIKAGFTNIPTVPVRAGSVSAVAQLDPGFDDARYRHSVNINRTFFKALQAAGVALQPLADPPTQLGTCTGGTETVTGYRPPAGYSFDIIGTDGQSVLRATDVVFFLKDTPPEAKSCGGIGAWDIPAAQLGASFFSDAGRLVFDPFSSRVWFGSSGSK